MKSRNSRWMFSSLMILCGLGIFSLGASSLQAGVETGVSSQEKLDSWTPEALRELSVIQKNAKESKADKSNANYFRASIVSQTKDQVKIIDSADLDGDGDIDIIYAAEGNDTIGWFENNGAASPNFTDNVLSTNEDGAIFVLAVDIDRDEDVDIVLCSRFSNEVSVWLNDGASEPTFTKQLVGTVPGANNVAAGDFDNNGTIDLVVPNPSENELTFFLNTNNVIIIISAGTISGETPAPLNFIRTGYVTEYGRPTYVASGDYDGFSGTDLAVVFRNTGNVVLMLNDSFNNTNAPSEKLVIVNPTQMNFEEYFVDQVERPQAVELANIDPYYFEDETPEIIVAAEKRDEILIYKNQNQLIELQATEAKATEKGNQFFFEKTYVTANFEASGRPNVGYADRPFFVKVADLNNDGLPDLLVPALGNNRFLWYEQINSFQAERSAEAQVDEKGIFISIFRKPVFHARSINRTFESPRSMIAADFNNDGLLDVAGTATLDDTIVMFANKGFQNPHLNPSISITTPVDQQVIFNETSVDVEGQYSMVTNPDLVDVMLLIDASGSIRNQTILNEIKEAALEFLNSVPVSISAATQAEEKGSETQTPRNVRVGMVIFQDNAILQFPLGSDIGQMIAFVPTITPGAKTNIAQALSISNTELNTNGIPGSNRMLYMISDGVETLQDGWLVSNTLLYPIHTYSTGLPLFSLPFPDPSLVEIGGGELLQDISFVSGGLHFYDQYYPHLSDLFNPESELDEIVIEYGVATMTAPAAGDKSILGGFVYPFFNNGFYSASGVPIELTEEGNVGTFITATLYTDELLPREYSATVTVYGEINGGPTQPTFSPVLHVALNNVPTDPDGDQILYKYRWTSDGEDTETLVGPTLDTESILREGPGVTFDAGETWTVEVTACDQNGFSSPVFTYSFVIGSGSLNLP